MVPWVFSQGKTTIQKFTSTNYNIMLPKELIIKEVIVVIQPNEKSKKVDTDLPKAVSRIVGDVTILPDDETMQYLTMRMNLGNSATLIHTDQWSLIRLSPEIKNLQDWYSLTSRNILAANLTESEISQAKRQSDIGFATVKIGPDPTETQIHRFHQVLSGNKVLPVHY